MEGCSSCIVLKMTQHVENVAEVRNECDVFENIGLIFHLMGLLGTTSPTMDGSPRMHGSLVACERSL